MYEHLDNTALAHEYLQTKAQAKEWKDALKDMEVELDKRLGNGDELNVKGKLYRWAVSVSPTTKYKAVLDWLHGNVSPDVQVLIEEGKLMQAHTGTRTSKDLKPVK